MTGEPVLLHVCCAPCSGAMIEMLRDEGYNLALFFYNPNIHPQDEYELRKDTIKAFAAKNAIPFTDADYTPEDWFQRVKGLEKEPERGARCTVCFDMRMARTALFAAEHNFTRFATSLGMSRRKNIDQVNASGHRAAARHENLVYWDRNWRKEGGTDRALSLAIREGFYRQTHCGCVFSRRENVMQRSDDSLSSLQGDSS